MAVPHLSIAGLSTSFGSKQVLRDLELNVAQGECLVVFGATGSGKTLLLHHIAGLMAPGRGSLRIDGHPVTQDSACARGVGLVFQDFALYPQLTAFENIASPLRARQMDECLLHQQVTEMAGLLGIDTVLGRMPRQLSNGQKQRTLLARSLVHRPRLLLLDEPLRHVDARLRFEMRIELPRLFKAFGSTVVYATQDHREALALGDRIGVLADGRFAQIDAPEAIYRHPCSRQVARLFGDPPINLFDVVPRDLGDGTLEVRVGSQPLRLCGVPAAATGRACVLGVRPEDVRFSVEPPPGALPVTLETVLAVNVRTVAVLKLGDGTRMLASRPEDRTLALQRQRTAGFATIDPQRCMLFDGATGARL